MTSRLKEPSDKRRLVGAPGAPNGPAVTDDVVWLELPESARRIARDSLRGAIAMVFGPLPAIAVTAHHDTQCGADGADDKASGVVALRPLPRPLRQTRLARSVRLISVGAEEQLSVGSTACVRQHRTTPRDTGLVFNFDAIASPLGHWGAFIAAPSRERGGEGPLRGAGKAEASRRKFASSRSNSLSGLKRSALNVQR